MSNTATLGRPFAVHLASVGLANLADGVISIGVPLVAIGLTRSPSLIGLLTAAVWLPWLVVGIPAGVCVDRWDRRTTRIAALAVRTGLLVGLAALAVAEVLSIWWLIAATLAYGVTEVFADLAGQAQIPALVGRDAPTLQRANARLLATEQVANGFLGAPTAGALIVAGTVWVIAVPAGLVLGCVLLIVGAMSGQYAAARPDGPARPMRSEIGEGLSVLWRHPVLRPIAIGGGLWNFASSAFSAVILLWLIGPGSAGGWSKSTFTWAVVALPIGALLGSWLAGRALRRMAEMTVIVVAWGTNAALNVVPVLWPRLGPVIGFFFLIGVVGVIGNVTGQSMRQRLVPEHQLGKIAGASRVIGYGMMPLGAVLGGQAANRFGIAPVLWGVVAVMAAATALVASLVPQRLVDECDRGLSSAVTS